MQNGLFIMIEGTDGSGKGTQTELLVKRLRNEGKPVETINFPRYGEPSAAMVEDYLNGKFGTAAEVGPYRASIFFAVDRYAAAPQIRQWLNDGKIVIANRYVGSNMAHNGGKIADPTEREKFFAWIDELEYTIFGIPRPDCSLILHVSPEISQRLVDQKTARAYLQGKKRDIHEADLRHLKQAADAYRYAAKKFGWVVIDCMRGNKVLPIEEIHERVFAAVMKVL